MPVFICNAVPRAPLRSRPAPTPPHCSIRGRGIHAGKWLDGTERKEMVSFSTNPTKCLTRMSFFGCPIIFRGSTEFRPARTCPERTQVMGPDPDCRLVARPPCLWRGSSDSGPVYSRAPVVSNAFSFGVPFVAGPMVGPWQASFRCNADFSAGGEGIMRSAYFREIAFSRISPHFHASSRTSPRINPSSIFF